MEQSYVIRNDRVIGKTVPNINYNYSTCPIGSIFAFSSERIPLGFFICDGASYKVAEYPDLYAVIGNTYGGDNTNFNVPDYRETVLVGVGENTTDTIVDHDVYELGEFKDDQFQGHWHNLGNSNGTVTVALGASIRGSSTNGAMFENAVQRYIVDTALDAITDGTNGEPRTGTTTHGKQKGVTYIIKAFHTNEGVDSGVSDDMVEYVEGKIDGLLDNSSTSETSTWSSSKIASEISQRFPNLSVPSTKALKITRNSIFSAFIKVMDVHGNLFTLQCGDQDNRFYVIPSYIGTNLSVDITKFVKEATDCYLYSNTYSMYVLEVIGDVSYSVIDKTAIPSTATTVTIA